MSCESCDKANCEPPSHLYLGICPHMIGVRFRVRARDEVREIGDNINCAVILMLYRWVELRLVKLELGGESTVKKK